MDNLVVKTKKKAEELAEYITKLEYGLVVIHSTIADIIGEPYGSSKYRSIVNQTKKILQEKYSRHIESVHKLGYRIIEPDNTVNLSLRHYNRGAREMQRGQNVLVNAPVNDMSQEGRETYRRVYDRAMLLNATVQKASVELKTVSKNKVHPFVNCVREA